MYQTVNNVRKLLTDDEKVIKGGALIGAKTAREAEEKAWADGASARAFSELRQDRDLKLSKTDWMTLADSPDISDEWKTYRQALRDFPSTLNDTTVLETITWPTEPS